MREGELRSASSMTIVEPTLWSHHTSPTASNRPRRRCRKGFSSITSCPMRPKVNVSVGSTWCSSPQNSTNSWGSGPDTRDLRVIDFDGRQLDQRVALGLLFEVVLPAGRDSIGHRW